nr:putative ribonuclease H-like domain-containing protein [Tanacetum cinerariifolium]
TEDYGRFGDQQEMLLIISPKTVDHTCLKDLTILIYKADSIQQWLGSPRETNSFILCAGGCSRHMTGNKSFLIHYQEIDAGFVAFEEVLKEATIDESKLWHKRLGHINFKTMNKLVSGNLVKDHLGKFKGRADEGFLVGYFVNITAGNQTNDDASIEINVNAGKAGQEKASDHEFILLPFMHSNLQLSSSTQSSNDKDTDEVPGKGVSEGSEIDDQERTDSSTQDVNTGRASINTDNTNINTGSLNINNVGSIQADINNLELSTAVSLIPTTRVHKDQPKEQIIGDLNLATQIRRMVIFSKENAMVSHINKQRRTNHKDYQNCLFACFLSQQEHKKVIQALTDPSCIEAMQEELL